MPARRIVAVSPDEAFGRELAAALQVAEGAVEVHQALDQALDHALGPDDLHAALWVLHLDGALVDAAGSLLPRLAGDGRVIVVLPHHHLPSIVDAMRASERVAGVLVADGFAPATLSAMARRILTGGGFGLEKAMTWGGQIHAQLVGDYHEKSLCMAQIAELVERVGVPRAHRASIEQCLDEVLMNALYDAPVDERGAPIFHGVPVKTRIALRTEQVVTVQYAFDGRQFGICVRDAYGSLERDAVLGVLHKCLHAEQPVDRRDGGAGVGLYLMASSSTAVQFTVAPGAATEVLCLFDVEAPGPELGQFGFFVEPIDPAEPRAPGPARRFSAGARRAAAPPGPPAWARRFVAAGLAIAIAAALVLIGVAAWPRVFGGGRAEVASTAIPADATSEIDGEIDGDDPLLDPRLGASDGAVRVRFVSKPPGARVVRLGQAPTADRTYTPAEVWVAANEVQRFMLTMPNHVPLVIAPFTPARGAGVLEKGGTLAEGATLRVEAAQGGKVTVSGAPHCIDIAVPTDCTLAPGRYTVEYVGPGNVKATRTVQLAGRDLTVTF